MSNLTPCTYTPPFFMIIIIPNIVQNLYLHLSMPLIMPPTLKKLMGHIAFGASVSAWVRGCVTLSVPTVTFKPLKLES